MRCAPPGVAEQKILPAYHKRLYAALSAVVGQIQTLGKSFLVPQCGKVLLHLEQLCKIAQGFC